MFAQYYKKCMWNMCFSWGALLFKEKPSKIKFAVATVCTAPSLEKSKIIIYSYFCLIKI